MADPEQRVKIVYDWSDADASVEARKNLNFNATFGSEGKGGGGGFTTAGATSGAGAAPQERLNQAMLREAVAREGIAIALERSQSVAGPRSSFDYSTGAGRYLGTTSIAGGTVAGRPVPERSSQYDDDFARAGRRDFGHQQKLERQVERYAQGMEAAASRESDRNEARFTRNKETAEFTAFRQASREADRNETRFGRASDAAQFARFRQEEREDVARPGRMSRAMSDFATQERGEREARIQAEAENDPDFIAANLAGARAQREADARRSGGGGGGRGSSGRLFQRFVALEGLRTAGAIVGAQLQYQQAVVTAGSNQTALANAALQRVQSIASGAPFGLGELALGAADIESGINNWAAGGAMIGDLTHARSQMAQAENANQLIAMRNERLDRTTALQNSARIANLPLGLARTTQQANDERDLSLIQNQRSAAEASNVVEQQFALKTSGGESFNPQDRTDALNRVTAARATQDAAAEAKRRGDINTAFNLSEGVNQRASADLGSIRLQSQLGARPAGEYTLEGMFSIEGRTSALLRGQAVERERMRNQHASEEDIVSREHPENLTAIQRRNAATREALETSQGQERGEFGVQASLELARTMNQLNTQIASNTAILNRDPLGSIEARGRGARSAALLIPDLAARNAAFDNAAISEDIEANQYRGERRLLGQRIDTRERVTGLASQAFGAGAGQFAARARIAGIVGGTETDAESRTLNDASDEAMRQADSIRRSGINELNTVRAQFFQSLSVGQGNANSFNMSPTGGTDAVELLKNIDDGIHELNANMGNLVATD